jgi:hypothetical protein
MSRARNARRSGGECVGGRESAGGGGGSVCGIYVYGAHRQGKKGGRVGKAKVCVALRAVRGKKHPPKHHAHNTPTAVTKCQPRPPPSRNVNHAVPPASTHRASLLGNVVPKNCRASSMVSKVPSTMLAPTSTARSKTVVCVEGAGGGGSGERAPAAAHPLGVWGRTANSILRSGLCSRASSPAAQVRGGSWLPGSSQCDAGR